MSNNQNTETHNAESAPILNFADLLARVNPKDRFLVAAIASFVDAQSAQKTVEALIAAEPIDLNRTMYGVKVRNILGVSKEKAREKFGLSEQEINEIHDYVGLQS